jgi:hypothetical protein
MKWYIVTMDEGVQAVCATKKEAKEWCRSTCLDSRKIAGWNRRKYGIYEYIAPINNSTRRTSYYVGTEQMLLKNGFDWALNDYKKEAEPVMTDEELFTLLNRKEGYQGVRLLTPREGVSMDGTHWKDDWKPEYLFNGVMWKCFTTSGLLTGYVRSYKTQRNALKFIRKHSGLDLVTTD